MNDSPWINLAVVVAVPLLVISQTGRNWLIGGRYSKMLWAVICAFALAGIVSVLPVFPRAVRPSMVVLVEMPLLQSLTYVALDRLFQALFGRPPVPLDEARLPQPLGGVQYWPDRSFWAVIMLLLLVGAVFLGGYFDLELPSRRFR